MYPANSFDEGEGCASGCSRGVMFYYSTSSEVRRLAAAYRSARQTSGTGRQTSGTGFRIGFWAFVFNYMLKTGFRICGLCDGLEPVLESGFEHSYLIMCSKRGSKITVF